VPGFGYNSMPANCAIRKYVAQNALPSSKLHDPGNKSNTN